jgi:hypothetical protein
MNKYIEYLVTTFAPMSSEEISKRLNFGITSAAEIFKNIIRETLEGLNGCINILVYGSNQKEHDNNLKSVLPIGTSSVS